MNTTRLQIRKRGWTICTTVLLVVGKGNLNIGSDNENDHQHHRHHRYITWHDASCPQNNMSVVEVESIDILELHISIISCLLQPTVFPGTRCRIAETVIKTLPICVLSHNLIATWQHRITSMLGCHSRLWNPNSDVGALPLHQPRTCRCGQPGNRLSRLILGYRSTWRDEVKPTSSWIHLGMWAQWPFLEALEVHHPTTPTLWKTRKNPVR